MSFVYTFFNKVRAPVLLSDEATGLLLEALNDSFWRAMPTMLRRRVGTLARV